MGKLVSVDILTKKPTTLVVGGSLVFENKDFGKVRLVEIKNEPWFVGKDLVEKLGYNLDGKHVASEYIKKYCDEEDYILLDKNSPVNQGAVIDYKELGQRGGYLVNESGMYSLVLSSELPGAKQFKRWVTSEVLPSLRKTGGFISNDDLFINTYLPFADDTTKLLFTNTLQTVRKQNELIAEQQKTISNQSKEIESKQTVIQGFCYDISVEEKRQIINDIVKQGGDYKSIQLRYKQLYKHFNLKHHIDVAARYENYCDKYNSMSKQERKDNNMIRIANKIDYIEKVLDMIPQLYEVCAKLYKSDVDKLIKEMYDLRSEVI